MWETIVRVPARCPVTDKIFTDHAQARHCVCDEIRLAMGSPVEQVRREAANAYTFFGLLRDGQPAVKAAGEWMFEIREVGE